MVDPLFRYAGKRVEEGGDEKEFKVPLSAAGEERVVERSNDRVSK
jgi:hypothetical protein